MRENRQIDQKKVRDHIDNVLHNCEQTFEKFFLAKFIGLDFDYLPENADDSDKEELKITFNINEMLRNPQGRFMVGLWQLLWIFPWGIY